MKYCPAQIGDEITCECCQLSKNHFSDVGMPSMRFLSTSVDGVVLVESEPVSDGRGSFARLYCPEEFAAAGIAFTPRQTSLSCTHQRLTLRGMHYTTEPEAKLVRCTRGRIFDVAADIRADSRTFRRWCGFELDPAGARALYIPAGVAHGFLTLEDDCDVIYQIDRIYRDGFDAGFRWDDPAFAIDWPARPQTIHPRDVAYPDFKP
jgi:dTDP-4-dehydrorhamnose 3,5-epimerase